MVDDEDEVLQEENKDDIMDKDEEDPIVMIAKQLEEAKGLGAELDSCRYCRKVFPNKIFEHESKCEYRPKRK